MRRYPKLCSLIDRKSLVISKLNYFELELRLNKRTNYFSRREDGITESAARLDKYKPSVLKKITAVLRYLRKVLFDLGLLRN